MTGYSGALGYYLLSYYYGAVPDAYEPDNPSATAPTLTLTAFLGTQAHTLHNTTDADWFRFQGVAGWTYSFYFTGKTYMLIYLYQDNGTTLISSDDDSVDDNNFNLQYRPKTTVYYKLKVVSYTNDAGAYSLYFRYVPLGSPVNLILARSGINAILSWSAVAGATFYKIYTSTNPYTGFTLLGQVGTTNVTITSPSAIRFFRVSANN